MLGVIRCLPMKGTSTFPGVRPSFCYVFAELYPIFLFQVRRLTALFQPAQVHSSVLAPRSPPEAKARDRGVHERVRESRPLSQRDAHTRDPYAHTDARSYPVFAHEGDQHVAYREVVPARREETSHDLYLTEKEYRAYGLRGDGRNVTSHSITSARESRRREYEGEHLLRQTNFIYRHNVRAHRENVHSDRPYLNDTHTIGTRRELPPATSATALDAYASCLLPKFAMGLAGMLGIYSNMKLAGASMPLLDAASRWVLND